MRPASLHLAAVLLAPRSCALLIRRAACAPQSRPLSVVVCSAQQSRTLSPYLRPAVRHAVAPWTAVVLPTSCSCPAPLPPSAAVPSAADVAFSLIAFSRIAFSCHQPPCYLACYPASYSLLSHTRDLPITPYLSLTHHALVHLPIARLTWFTVTFGVRLLTHLLQAASTTWCSSMTTPGRVGHIS